MTDTVMLTINGVECSYDREFLRSLPRTIVNGVAYLDASTGRHTLTVTMTAGEGTEFRNGTMESVNRCGCCGRADVREAVAYSFDEVLERGWLIPLPDDL